MQISLQAGALGGQALGKGSCFDVSKYCFALEEGVGANHRGSVRLDKCPGRPTVHFDITATWLGEGKGAGAPL